MFIIKCHGFVLDHALQQDEIDRRHLEIKEGGSGLASMEDRVDVSLWGLEDNIRKRIENTYYSDQKQHMQH